MLGMATHWHYCKHHIIHHYHNQVHLHEKRLVAKVGEMQFTGRFYRLEEAGVLTDCSIQTQEANETLDFDFCSANVVNKIIMSAEGLREAFAELDMTSDSLEILLSPSSPYFRLSTFGYAGMTQVLFIILCWLSMITKLVLQIVGSSYLISFPSPSPISISLFPYPPSSLSSLISFLIFLLSSSSSPSYIYPSFLFPPQFLAPFLPSLPSFWQIDYPKDSDMMEVFECRKIQSNK